MFWGDPGPPHSHAWAPAGGGAGAAEWWEGGCSRAASALWRVWEGCVQGGGEGAGCAGGQGPVPELTEAVFVSSGAGWVLAAASQGEQGQGRTVLASPS